MAEAEFVNGAGGLDFNISEIKNGLDDAACLYRYILNAREIELGDAAHEEAFLKDVDDALIGNDPGVEKVDHDFKADSRPKYHVVGDKGDEYEA